MINKAFYTIEQQLENTDLCVTRDFGPLERTPFLILMSNLCDEDLNGLFVLSRLSAFLRNIAAGRRRGLQLRERVVITPVDNATHARNGENRNLSLGGPAEWLKSAYYRIQLSAAPDDLETLPQVWLCAPSDDERASACLFGLPAVVERDALEPMPSSFLQDWCGQGGENMVICTGQSGTLQTRHCEMLFRALVAFLERIGVISGLRLVEDDEDVHYFNERASCEVRAPQSGIFYPNQEVGSWIVIGETLGWIHDGFTGELQTPVVAPTSGLLVGLRRQPLLCEGTMIARILVSTVGG